VCDDNSEYEDLGSVGDRLRLRDLVDRYALAVDGRDSERFAALFTVDGVLRGFQLGETRPLMQYVGREQLRNVIGERASRFLSTFHVIANHTCEMSAGQACGVAYCMAHHLTDEDGELIDTLMLIRYHDRYRLTGDGWLISERDAIRHWTTTSKAQQ
jgi:hypothetical protein